MLTVKKFKELLEANESLSLEYKNLVDGKNEDKIIGFMKTNGVSQEDLNALKNRELNEDELDGVVGGARGSSNSERFWLL